MLNYTEQNLHRYNKEKRTSFITFIDCGITYAPKGWQHKQRFLESYELIYVSRGAVHLESDGEAMSISAGQAGILPPYKTFCGISPCEDATSFYTLGFMTDNRDVFKISGGIVTIGEHSEFEDILKSLDKSVKQNSPDFVKDSYLIILLNELDRRSSKDFLNNRLAETVASYIEQNISEPLTVAKIAEDLSYNKDYLNKTVKSFYGITLKNYITAQKINAAKRLLTTSNYTTADISQYLGFDDPNVFTKFFKYHVKVSPMQYKKEHL